MKYKRCERPAPDTTIRIWELGSSCSVYQNMLNKIDALRRQQNPWVDCDLNRFNVTWQQIDVMHYMFVLKDNATQETFQWSVEKEWPRETAEHAFERDYNESAIRYNAGAYRALQDYTEALQDEYPVAGYKLQERAKGWRVFRPLMLGVGVVPFEIEFYGVPGPVIQDRMIHHEIWEYLATVPGEHGRALERMVRRQIKAGAVFNSVERKVIKDYRTMIFKGYAPRSSESHTAIVITLQEIAMTDLDLAQYHEYYTE